MANRSDLRFKQICVGQYTGAGRDSRQSFVVIGLSEDGKVYQFKGGKWQNLEEMFPGRTEPVSMPRSQQSDEEAPW